MSFMLSASMAYLSSNLTGYYPTSSITLFNTALSEFFPMTVLLTDLTTGCALSTAYE